MFITKAYRTSTILALSFIVFACLQLFINFKRGIVSSPFFHYGMYSQVHVKPKNLAVFAIKVNNTLLEPYSFAAQEWDKIILPLQAFDTLQQNYHQQKFSADIGRLLQKIHLQPNAKHFNQNLNKANFTNWYTHYLSNILHLDIQKLEIDKLYFNTYTTTAPTLLNKELFLLHDANQ